MKKSAKCLFLTLVYLLCIGVYRYIEGFKTVSLVSRPQVEIVMLPNDKWHSFFYQNDVM